MTKNKPIYHAWNVNRWKGSVKPRPFIALLILGMINRFIFDHGVVIYYIGIVYLNGPLCKNVVAKDTNVFQFLVFCFLTCTIFNFMSFFNNASFNWHS